MRKGLHMASHQHLHWHFHLYSQPQESFGNDCREEVLYLLMKLDSHSAGLP